MRKKLQRKILVFALITITFLMFSITYKIEAIGVRPLVIDLEMSPGESREFEITLTPAETEQIVNLNFYQPVQLDTGSLTYQEADPAVFPAVSWIELDQNRVELPVEENRVVRGTVTAPFDAGASHTVVIMVEPEVEEAQQGVSFRVRYAVRLNINITRSGLRPSAEVDDFDFYLDEESGPTVNTIFRNTSPLHYDVSAEATLRDERGTLVERFPLKTAVAWQGGRDSTRIYPGSELIYTGNLTRQLHPGNYELRLFFRYGGGRQIIERHDINVEEGFQAEDSLESIRLNPAELELNLRPGAVSSQPIEIENLSGESKTISLSPRDIDANYPYSIFNSLDVSIRGGQEVELRPYGRQRVVLSIQAPRDLSAAGYYGFLDIIELDDEDKEELASLSLQVVSNEDELESKAEIIALHHEKSGDDDIFSIEISNTGNIHFSPEGSLVLRDSDGNVYRDINLNVDGSIARILPDRSELIIIFTEEVAAGEYLAEVSLLDQNRELANQEFEIIVE